MPTSRLGSREGLKPFNASAKSNGLIFDAQPAARAFSASCGFLSNLVIIENLYQTDFPQFFISRPASLPALISYIEYRQGFLLEIFYSI